MDLIEKYLGEEVSQNNLDIEKKCKRKESNKDLLKQ